MDFKYDVAFSFLKADEEVATSLTAFLSTRMKVFLYSRAQEDLAGRDGEQEFNKVFGSDARIVVVLFRKGWGETPWTRIELTAIRNRAYEHGYDFCTFIALEPSPQMPEWLPKNRLWIGLERYGLNAAAAVIESRVQEVGGTPATETAVSQARLIDEMLHFQSKRDGWRMTEGAALAARKEVEAVYTNLEVLCAQISASNSKLALSLKRPSSPGLEANIFANDFFINIRWSEPWTNSLNDSGLHCRFLRFPPLPQRSHVPPVLLNESWFDYDMVPGGSFAWKQRDAASMFSSKLLADYCVSSLLAQIQKIQPWAAQT